MIALPIPSACVKLAADRVMARAISVPWVEMSDGDIDCRNIFADTKSFVIGSCTKASPANTTIPSLSFENLSIILLTSNFVLSNLDGATSVASIEFDTSIATTTSMPLRFSFDIRVPICGRAIITTSSASAARSKIRFTTSRRNEYPEIMLFTNGASPIRDTFFRHRRKSTIKINATGISSSSSHRYCGSANLIIFFLISERGAIPRMSLQMFYFNALLRYAFQNDISYKQL